MILLINKAIPKHFPLYFIGKTSFGITKFNVDNPKEKVPTYKNKAIIGYKVPAKK